MDEQQPAEDWTSPESPHYAPSQVEPRESTDPAAWQEVAPGRFLPMRVRGSCVGRALG